MQVIVRLLSVLKIDLSLSLSLNCHIVSTVGFEAMFGDKRKGKRKRNESLVKIDPQVTVQLNVSIFLFKKLKIRKKESKYTFIHLKAFVVK
jgi:hypothetical protein